MAIILDTNLQTVRLNSGEYVISTFLNGGTASIDVQHLGSVNWAPAGTLTTEPQVIRATAGGKLRLTKTGSALVEISQ